MGLLDPKPQSTQEHLDIEDIRDDLIVLKTGKISLLIETTSLNFDLLAGNEQDARIITFAGLLNSLTFPIQIVIRTQQTDVSKYLTLLDEYKSRVMSPGLQTQVEIYQDFIKQLTSNTQILNKRFYIVIPTLIRIGVMKTNPVMELLGQKPQILNVHEVIEKAKSELYPKRDHILKQLGNMGLAAKQMNNDELIKLYYSIYEPDKVGVEIMTLHQDNIDGAVISSQVGDVMPTVNNSAAAQNPFADKGLSGSQVPPTAASSNRQ